MTRTMMRLASALMIAAGAADAARADQFYAVDDGTTTTVVNSSTGPGATTFSEDTTGSNLPISVSTSGSNTTYMNADTLFALAPTPAGEYIASATYTVNDNAATAGSPLQLGAFTEQTGSLSGSTTGSYSQITAGTTLAVGSPTVFDVTHYLQSVTTAYVGFDLSIDGQSGSASIFGGNTTLGTINTGSPVLTITYEAAAVPEPASVTMMGIAAGIALGCARLRRRRAARAQSA